MVARLGVGYEDLKERFPRLIVMSLSGYGQTGPDRTRPAYGMTMEVASGPASVTGYRDGGVSKTGQTWVDGYAGLHGAAALVAALIYRERSGRGQYIDVSMQEATAPMLDWHLADYLLNGRLHGGDGNRRRGAVRGVYPSAGNDDWVAHLDRETSHSGRRSARPPAGSIGWPTSASPIASPAAPTTTNSTG